MTREEYLIKASEHIKDIVFTNYTIPKFKISTGFTGTKKGLKAIGSCWRAEASEDNVAQIFISPVIDDTIEVLGVLIHEIIHAIYPDSGHKGLFRKAALDVGLEGKMTATTVGAELKERLNALVENIGLYPHAKLNPSQSGIKKQGTRLLKCACDCGYNVRITKQWIEIALPICPLCKDEMVLQ
jgi:hypothetical protein